MMNRHGLIAGATGTGKTRTLQATIAFLISDEGKGELKGIGGLSSATAGVILREIVTLQSQRADVFFGEPAFSTGDLLRLAPDGRRLISALELPTVQDRPALFSMFLMWLLADLFPELPEVGDQDKPKLVFFFDEAHLLFTDAWTRLRAPLSSMTPAPDPTILATVSASPSQARYGAAVDRESAYELLLTKRMATIDAEQAKAEADAAAAKEQTESERTTSSRSSRDPGGIIETVVKSSGFNSFLRSADTVLGREITRTIFGTRSR